MKRLLLVTLLGLACSAAQAAGQSPVSQASANLSAVVVGGSISGNTKGGNQ